MRDRLSAIVLVVITITAMSGCIFERSWGPQADSIWANVSETYNVVDNSGHNVDYAYPLDKQSGHFTSANFLTGHGGGSGPTYSNGSTYGQEAMWPVNPGDYIVFGASNNSSWLKEDLDNKQFSPGKAGYWIMLTYDDIKRQTNGSQNTMMNITITVSNETGKMLKST
jgi:hypothetical protein